MGSLATGTVAANLRFGHPHAAPPDGNGGGGDDWTASGPGVTTTYPPSEYHAL
jgi:hypothetical protein